MHLDCLTKIHHMAGQKGAAKHFIFIFRLDITASKYGSAGKRLIYQS